jgi:hypothetical protein
MMIVESLLLILDKLGLLLTRRDALASKRFSLFSEAFTDLLAVHGDYIQMFEKTLQLLPSLDLLEQTLPNEDLAGIRAAAKQLRERRITFEPVRVKLRALAPELGAMSLPAVEREFVAALIDYFPSFETKCSLSWSVLSFLELVDAHEMPDYRTALFHALMLIRGVIDFQQRHWSTVCEAYARLRVAATK